MQRKRILYVESNPDGTVGGSFFSLLYLAAGVDRARFEPIVLFNADNSLLGRFEEAGVRVVIRPKTPPVGWRSPPGRLFGKLANFWIGFVAEPLRLARYLREERIALLHLNNSITRNHQWIMAAMLAGVPCVTHERGINPQFSRRSVWLGRRLRAVICISAAVRQNFMERGVTGLQLVDIPNALDPAKMQVRRSPEQIRAELGLSASSRIIGMVGNIKHWKGQEVVIGAMRELRQRFPDLACLLVGDSSPNDAAYRRHVDSLIAEAGLNDRVLITGYRADVADYVNAMEILVHASIRPEPFGRVLLEGMALRKPLVASGEGAVPEIVSHEDTGLLFKPGDAKDLADKLSALLLDPEKIRRLGESGYARLESSFSIRSNIAQTEALYTRVLAHL